MLNLSFWGMTMASGCFLAPPSADLLSESSVFKILLAVSVVSCAPLGV